jgi:octaprenyl-diphosphate synthase
MTLRTSLAPRTPRALRLANERSPQNGLIALNRALSHITDRLDAVSGKILSELADPVAKTVVYLIVAGGKRLRPALVLLAGASGPAPKAEALVDLATAVELIHTATLIHDDIIDRSPLRRSQPAFHERWGTERAVLMGDYLHATAFTLVARQDPAVMQVIADVCRQLCRGELREVEARYRLDLSEDEYLDIVRDKTASLIAGSCRCGAYLSGCDAAAIEGLAAFGMSFGLAFQIIDDCLDLSGDPDELGKSILTDLDKGCLSLPIIYLAEQLSEAERRRLFAPLRRGAADPAFLARVAAAARRTGAIVKARNRAASILNEGLSAISRIRMNGTRGAFEDIAEYAMSRRS